MLMRTVASLGLAAFAAQALSQSTAPASSPAARRAVGAAIGRMLQGDGAQAAAILGSVAEGEFAANDARFRSCVIGRFRPDADGSLPADLPPFAARIVGIYRAYWRIALARPAEREGEEDRLRRNLARLLGLPPVTALERIEPLLVERLRSDGYHALLGRTAPLRELMLWRQQTEQTREVPLPEGPFTATVMILDDFASLGWSNFATCGRSVSGGWVRSNAIYAVRPGWADLTGERFLVSFLGHETQHFADLQRYGSLPSWELEYRAKLAELAMARTSVSILLTAFTNNQGDDPAIPHAYANKRVLAALRERLALPDAAPLDTVPPDAVNRAAEAELRADSQRRRQR